MQDFKHWKYNNPSQLFYFPFNFCCQTVGFLHLSKFENEQTAVISYGLASLSVIPFLKSWTWKYMLP